MAKKRRPIKEKEKPTSSSVESDDEVRQEQIKEESVKRTRVLRSRSSTKPSEIKSKATDAYDADSEDEPKLDKPLALSDGEEEFVLLKPEISLSELKKSSLTKNPINCQQNTTAKGAFSNLKDFSVNLEDCLLSPEKSGCKPSTKLDNNNFKTPGNSTSLLDEKKARGDLENVTPPDVHSTPNVISKVAKNLDESLFGFTDAVEKRLDYSSINIDGGLANSPSILSTQSSNASFARKTYSRLKRKCDLGFDDLPIEGKNATIKSKRSKKKKKEQSANIEKKEGELWESLRQQFQEVEMHELVVE